MFCFGANLKDCLSFLIFELLAFKFELKIYTICFSQF